MSFSCQHVMWRKCIVDLISIYGPIVLGAMSRTLGLQKHINAELQHLVCSCPPQTARNKQSIPLHTVGLWMRDSAPLPGKKLDLSTSPDIDWTRNNLHELRYSKQWRVLLCICDRKTLVFHLDVEIHCDRQWIPSCCALPCRCLHTHTPFALHIDSMCIGFCQHAKIQTGQNHGRQTNIAATLRRTSLACHLLAISDVYFVTLTCDHTSRSAVHQILLHWLSSIAFGEDTDSISHCSSCIALWKGAWFKAAEQISVCDMRGREPTTQHALATSMPWSITLTHWHDVIHWVRRSVALCYVHVRVRLCMHMACL